MNRNPCSLHGTVRRPDGNGALAQAPPKKRVDQLRRRAAPVAERPDPSVAPWQCRLWELEL
jgi:hypothetical protein